MRVLGPTEYQAQKEFISGTIAAADLFRTLSPEQQKKLEAFRGERGRGHMGRMGRMGQGRRGGFGAQGPGRRMGHPGMGPQGGPGRGGEDEEDFDLDEGDIR